MAPGEPVQLEALLELQSKLKKHSKNAKGKDINIYIYIIYIYLKKNHNIYL